MQDVPFAGSKDTCVLQAAPGLLWEILPALHTNREAFPKHIETPERGERV